METIKKYILEQVATRNLSRDNAKAMLSELESIKEYEKDDIAIIGMAGKLPQAGSIKEYWENIKQANNCITEFPEARRADSDIYVMELLKEEGIKNVDIKDAYRMGGFLASIDKFDEEFFNLTKIEAEYMEPNQRLFLEAAWEAIENAGLGGKRIYGTQTGVFVGKDHTVESAYKRLDIKPGVAGTAGLYASILASRVSYIFNLSGPAIVIDTACSSALVALHMACNAIKNNECELAIVGGVAVSYRPTKNNSFVDAADSVVRAFDKKASGTVWSEGVGAVILKPMKKAIKDKDHIHAIVKGTAINNDGASNGILSPSAEAQESVLINCWKGANIDPETISYIETHGTGTNLGDPIEIKGIVNAFERFTDKKQFCGIGSVKTNIGHTQAASGMASLFKVIMSMKEGKIAASINFDEPNPYIKFPESPVYLNDKLVEWTRGETPRRAGISAFGFSGTNAHVVIEEAPLESSQVRQRMNDIMTLSAKSEEALSEYIDKYSDFVNESSLPDISDICYSANTGREHYEYRLAMVIKDNMDFKDKIRALIGKDLKNINLEGVYYSRIPVQTRVKKAGTASGADDDTEMVSNAASSCISAFNESGDEVILSKICELYVKGAEIEWDELYYKEKRIRVCLPTYPFQRERYWAPQRQKPGYESFYEKEIRHPLVDRCVISILEQDIYYSSMDTKRLWILQDHKVAGNSTVPGTALVEMVREICTRYLSESKIEFQNIIFMSPLMVGEDGHKDVYTILKKNSRQLEVVVASKTDGDEEVWLKHMEAKVISAFEAKPPNCNLIELKKRLDIKDIQLDMSESPGYFKFGRRWNGLEIKEVYVGDGEALVKLAMPDDLKKDLEEYYLHPSLMDVSVNSGGLAGSGGEYYLPLSYKKMVVYAPTPPVIYCYSKLKKSGKSNNQTKTYELLLTDETGKAFAAIEEYTLKKVRKNEIVINPSSAATNIFYEIKWVEKAREVAAQQMEAGCTLILKDESGLWENIGSILKSEGNEVIYADIGNEYSFNGVDKYTLNGSDEDFRKIFDSIKGKGIATIIHMLAAGETKDMFGQSLESLEKAQERGVFNMFRMIKGLLECKMDSLEIVIVAREVDRVTGKETGLNPQNASLCGIGKVIGQEYLQYRCRCIDIDENVTADVLAEELKAREASYRVALRSGKRYVEEFGQIDIEALDQADIEIKSEGVYVITGGTGGIGLEMAKYLTENTCANLCLVNRSKMPPREEWGDIVKEGVSVNAKLYGIINAVKEIEKNGSNVVIKSCDVSKPEEMEPIFEGLRKQFGRINGIIHSAGVAGEGFIIKKEEDVFRKVLLPKVYGTYLIDKLTRKDNPDFIILFSSMMSVFGGAGQSDYVAGNSYIDAYTSYRNSLGMRTLAINWSAWRETGMASDYNFAMDSSSFKALTTARAMNAFDMIFNKRLDRVIIGEFNHSADISLDENVSRLRYNPGIVKKLKEALKKSVSDSNGKQEVNVVLRGREDNQYSEIELKVGRIWCEILGISEIDIFEDFYKLGGDSIHAIKIVNSVYNNITQEVDISDIFEHHTLVDFSEFIYLKLNKTADDSKPADEEKKDIGKVQNNQFDLSYSQNRIWFLQKSNPAMTAYNLVTVLKFGSDFKFEYYEKAIGFIVSHHEAMRTVIKEENGIPYQIILDKVVVIPELVDLSSEIDNEKLVEKMIEAENKIVFDLSKPLFRTKVYKLNDSLYYLYYNMHHIVADGWSFDLIVKDVSKAYIDFSNKKVPKLKRSKTRYVDWVEKQKNWFKGEEYRKIEEYWLEELSKPLPVLNLPINFKRPPVQTFNGSYKNLRLSFELSSKIRDVSARNDISLHMFFLSAYFLVLNKISGDKDIIVGVPFAGRDNKELEDVIGIFINNLCIRVDFQGIETYRSLLDYVKQKSIKSYKNSKYPFDILVTKINPDRDLSRNPVFSTMFQFFDYIPRAIDSVSLFDIVLYGRNDGDVIELRIEFNTDLFISQTIDRILNDYINILSLSIENLDMKLVDFNLGSECEKVESADIDGIEFEFR